MVTLTVIHSLGDIPLVTKKHHAGDALAQLSGLDIEPESDEALFAPSANSGLPSSTRREKGTIIPLEDNVPRLPIENTQLTNTRWELIHGGNYFRDIGTAQKVVKTFANC